MKFLLVYFAGKIYIAYTLHNWFCSWLCLHLLSCYVKLFCHICAGIFNGWFYFKRQRLWLHMVVQLYYKTFFTSLEDRFHWLATISSVALPAVIVGVISVVVAKVIARSILQAECLRHRVIIFRHQEIPSRSCHKYLLLYFTFL